MKKLFFTILCFTLAVVSFTSCISSNEDEKGEEIVGEYKFFEPVLDWGVDKAMVRMRMADKANWNEDRTAETENALNFYNPKTYTTMTYEFRDKKLIASSVIYLNCHEKYNQMKSDWADKLNITWKQMTQQGITFYVAESEQYQCDITANDGVSGGIYFMGIHFSQFGVNDVK